MEQQQEVQTTAQDIWALFKETDRKFQETDRKFQETDRLLSQKFQETDRLLSQKFRETDRLLSQKFQETDNEVKRVSTNVDKLADKWGRFVEGLVIPGVIKMFKKRDIDIEKVSQRLKVHKNTDKMEIDILGVNGEYAVLVEAKSTLNVDDVKDHIERLKAFKRFFPEYSDKKVIGAVAGIVINQGADKFAYRQGMFVIAQSGETVTILNDNKFEPKIW
ncbi:DUF3782 domain-containing protein [Candidatus Magnetomoraceae bacterium gMMP-15]